MENRNPALVFGEVADDYDRVRPAYPVDLFRDVLSYSKPDIGGRLALDVGAGTGRATEAFAREGLPVVALEPDDAMAEVLARRVTPFPDVQVVRGSFEEFRPPQRFGLLFSAEAWHWTAPETRWSLAADALADGATLALFWNTERIAEPALRTRMLETFAAHAPSVIINDEPVTAEQILHRWPGDELSAVAAFESLASPPLPTSVEHAQGGLPGVDPDQVAVPDVALTGAPGAAGCVGDAIRRRGCRS